MEPSLFVVNHGIGLRIHRGTHEIAGKCAEFLSGEIWLILRPWPHKHTQATLYVWAAHKDAGSSLLDVEPIKAEVVLLVRQRTGQWPSGQTEIHFHPSSKVHRIAATAILNAIA